MTRKEQTLGCRTILLLFLGLGLVIAFFKYIFGIIFIGLIGVGIYFFIQKKKQYNEVSCAKVNSMAVSPTNTNTSLRTKSNNLQPISKSKEKPKKDNILDPFSAIVVDIPKLPKPDFQEERKPQEYWNGYNNGVSFYNRGWYEKAKEEFLKLLVFNNPHSTFYTYLLRTYRKIVNKLIEKEKFEDAFESYEEFFNVCREHITDTDRRNFNKLVDILVRQYPERNFQKTDLKGDRDRPDFEVKGINVKMQFVMEIKNEIKSQSRIKNSHFIDFGEEVGTFYVNNIYDRENSSCSSSIVLRNNLGSIEKELFVDHDMYRFKAANSSKKFITSSAQLNLYYYSLESGCLGSLKLNRYSEDKYHVRCVDISPEGEFLLFTNVDQAYLLDSNLKVLNNWRTPPKDGWEKRTNKESPALYAEYQRCLSVLGLTGEPTREDIKKAFKNLIIQYHPDKNPDDPTANEKTKELIMAYEKLTGEGAEQALRDLNNSEYYYKVMERIKIDIPEISGSLTIEIGMVGLGEDWIYATCLGSNADRIYLGCYSGKIYCVTKNSQVIKLYNCHSVIRGIREKREYLFVETAEHLIIFKNDKYLNHIDIWQKGALQWFEKGFMLIGTKDLQIFSDEGIELGQLFFKNSIYDIYWIDRELNLVTPNKTYIFSIS